LTSGLNQICFSFVTVISSDSRPEPQESPAHLYKDLLDSLNADIDREEDKTNTNVASVWKATVTNNQTTSRNKSNVDDLWVCYKLVIYSVSHIKMFSHGVAYLKLGGDVEITL